MTATLNGGSPPTWDLAGPPGPYDAPPPLAYPPAPSPHVAHPTGPSAAVAQPPAPAPLHPFTEEPAHLVALGQEPAHLGLGQAPLLGAPPPALGLTAPPLTTTRSGHLLGAATLLVGVGALAGVRLGGVYGGAAGALFGGAATNLYRALSFGSRGDPASDREAVVSGTYALAAAVVGGYVAWRVSERSDVPLTPNRRPAQRNAPRACKFRPIGP